MWWHVFIDLNKVDVLFKSKKVVEVNQDFCGATLWTEHQRTDGRLCITNFPTTFPWLQFYHLQSQFR